MNKNSSVQEILDQLNELADPDKAKFKEMKFGIPAGNSLGIYQADLNDIAKSLGKENDRALELYKSGIYEARILCAKTFRPKDLSLDLAEEWIVDFENWEVCDVFCMKLFAPSPIALDIIRAYYDREPEFEKRASFATMAGYCSADKTTGNEVFLSFLPYIIAASTDDRNFVKKAVNWALRSIGKRNRDLLVHAIDLAENLSRSDTASARWIAKDAIKELTGSKVRISDYPRSIYRPV
jgi:3-methyladenine DNA glycosylase AlkD